MQIKSTLKQLIKNNPLYKDFIHPMRVKLKEKALAKLDDESYFIKRHKKIFGYTPDFKIMKKSFIESCLIEMQYTQP